MRVLEVSLRKAGFTVTTAVSVQDALDKLELDAPDLIISETTFPDGDGFELRRKVRATPEWDEIPFIFLTAEAAIENKIRGLELGVDDYLTKPIYIKEIVTRINILLQKRQRIRFEERRDGRTRFAGRVTDMPVVDVIQTIEISRKSGVIQFVGDRGRQAAIYFRDGRVIDAEAGALQGEDAVYRLLTWSEGEFEVVFRTVRRREVINTSSQGLLMEGMRRLDEWSRLLEQLPPLTHRFEVDTGELSIRLGDIPDDNNLILRLIDGKRTLLEVIDASDVGDLECLQAISKLYFEEMLMDLDHGAPVRRDTGKPIPLVEVDAPTPIEDAASGPIPNVDELEDEEPDIIDEITEPGALMGGYRQSSLRLIDEAVAAAQAIEPSQFDDEVEALMSGPNVVARPNGTLRSGNGVPKPTETQDSVPHEISQDDPTPPPRPTPRPGREDSGLRMIGSLGRDRAEASGELVPLGAPQPSRSETQRELVTILPRRITREMAIVAPPPDAVPAAGEPVQPVVELPAPVSVQLPPPPKLNTVGTGVRRAAGPGQGAIVLLVLAGILTCIAVYLYLTRNAHKITPKVASYWDANADSGPPIITPIHDAAVNELRDAASAVVDARVAAVDAGRIAPVQGDAGVRVDPAVQAKLLYEQAGDAIKESDFTKALALADASLKLRRTARTYLLRAQALQRLDRVEEALASIDAAESITKDYPTVYELRARILRAARRKDEAREAMEQYLKLVPTGPTAAQFERWLNEPR
jgi:CheY-like chemotaxis protein